MNIEQLYQDFNIQYVTEGHKHSRPGWVNTECPFCTGNPGYHLGYDTIGEKFVCWRCGGKNTVYALSAVLKVGKDEVNTLLRQYGQFVSKQRQAVRKINIKAFKLPPCLDLEKNHKQYLISRGFSPKKIIEQYAVKGSGVFSRIEKIDYKHRIIIPFVWDGKIVSFDSRDITGKSMNKYMACPEDREIIGHKNILYGRPDKWTDFGICVEGPTDVWRMGKHSFAVSGIKYKPQQVRWMAKLFKRIAVLFDPEPQAKIQANKLVADLRFRGVDAFRVDLKEGEDPGALTDEEAEYLVRQLVR